MRKKLDLDLVLIQPSYSDGLSSILACLLPTSEAFGQLSGTNRGLHHHNPATVLPAHRPSAFPWGLRYPQLTSQASQASQARPHPPISVVPPSSKYPVPVSHGQPSQIINKTRSKVLLCTRRFCKCQCPVCGWATPSPAMAVCGVNKGESRYVHTTSVMYHVYSPPPHDKTLT